MRVSHVKETKTAADAGSHLAEVKPKKYTKVAVMIRTAMAYAEYALGLSVDFKRGVGEIDSFNNNTSRVRKVVPVALVSSIVKRRSSR